MAAGTKSGGETQKQAARGFVFIDAFTFIFQKLLFSLSLQTHQLLSLT